MEKSGDQLMKELLDTFNGVEKRINELQKSREELTKVVKKAETTQGQAGTLGNSSAASASKAAVKNLTATDKDSQKLVARTKKLSLLKKKISTSKMDEAKIIEIIEKNGGELSSAMGLSGYISLLKKLDSEIDEQIDEVEEKTEKVKEKTEKLEDLNEKTIKSTKEDIEEFVAEIEGRHELLREKRKLICLFNKSLKLPDFFEKWKNDYIGYVRPMLKKHNELHTYVVDVNSVLNHSKCADEIYGLIDYCKERDYFTDVSVDDLRVYANICFKNLEKDENVKSMASVPKSTVDFIDNCYNDIDKEIKELEKKVNPRTGKLTPNTKKQIESKSVYRDALAKYCDEVHKKYADFLGKYEALDQKQ